MKIKQYKPKDRIVSEQYVIDKDGYITIPSDTLFNAGLSSDKEFVVLEKYSVTNVYYIVPANFEYDEREYGFLFNPKVENGNLKFCVKGLFDHLKSDDSVSLDVFEFQLILYDRSNVVKRESEEETGFDTRKIDWKKEFDELEKNFRGNDPYAPDENTIKMMGDNLDKKLNFNNILDDIFSNNNTGKKPDFKKLDKIDKMLGNLLNDILSNSTKKLHASKDPLLNEFIEDMLARVYGKDGQKVIMISNVELQQFIDDMTYWYNRIKKGN